MYEEYRYDALGRRILKRTRHDSVCPVNDAECASVVERTIWDGDHVLYEIRSLGHDTTGAANVDNDVVWTTSAQAYSFGRVAYTNGGGIDQPLGIIRMGMMQQLDPWVIFPHANWRGSVEGGSNVNGTTCWGSDGNCLIPWPGRKTTADGELAQPSLQFMWFGNLLSGKTDGSGLQYMRNRYYDPKTGRFTQEDPLGLAGGLNLYGFANGDPVNFSDPFGLCPQHLTGRPCLNPLAALGGRLALRADGQGAFDSPRRSPRGGFRQHRAADLSAPLGTAVGAADRGLVVRVDREGLSDAGKYVIVGHPDAEGNIVSFTAYMHLSEIAPSLAAGESEVAPGELIGRTGNTGNAKGEPPHLHFEIRTQRRGGQLDPADHLEIRRP